MHPIARSAAVGAILVSAAGLPAAAQSGSSIDAAALEQVCRQNAPDEAMLDQCLAVVRDVLAPEGSLTLPDQLEPVDPGPVDPADAAGVGVTQATDTLLVTLSDVAWDAAIFPRDEVDVVAAEFTFESIHPEAYVDLSGLVAIDEDGFAHTWGAMQEAGESPVGGFLAEGRKLRGWVGFEIPPGTDRIELEYQDVIGRQPLVWVAER